MITSVDLSAGDIMDKAAGLMNDNSKQIYTYTVQLSYLNMALQDLRKLLQLNNSPVTNEESTVIKVVAGITNIGFTTNPKLPSDLIEIRELWERPTNSNPFIPMSKRDFIPHYLEGTTINQLLIWAWESNEIKFLPANADIDIKINYIRSLFTNVVNENASIAVINSDSYLEYRTAALLAEFIGENPSRATSLNNQATEAFNIMAGIDNKGKQSIPTRRRPFRSAWKQRAIW